jgi:hypothetical protein
MYNIGKRYSEINLYKDDCSEDGSFDEPIKKEKKYGTNLQRLNISH